jgi:alpha-amylase/alpha-mannosidase (GH57 family)
MANVVFLWHMHQPYYVDPTTRTAMMPWVRLHAVKGYLDMITVLREFPEIRANFNLTPVLMRQVEEIAEGRVRDLWFDWAAKPASDLTGDERLSILENFFKIHWDNLLKPFPRYRELLNKRGVTFYRDDVRNSLRYWSAQDLRDLQVWFNLSWCGYTAFKQYPELGELRRKGRGFTEEEKGRVLAIHMEILRGLSDRYAKAEGEGQVELTTTPYFHPILPLVYDSQFAERNLPGREMPKRFSWPQDAEAQLRLASEQHERMFGRRPRGLWPSEGSIAPELIPLMQRVGIEYFCSDEDNLFRSIALDPSLSGRPVDHLELFQGWGIGYDGATVNALFREKPLSDFIGFMAAKNDPITAAQHLLGHLKQIAGVIPKDQGVVPLILDGENAWETFGDGGESFLKAFYGGIAADRDHLHSCTIEDYFRHHPPRRHLRTLHTGSWISSNFDIWIGDPEENDAWERLGEARDFLQRKIEAGSLDEEVRQKALDEIYAAEGSDWFWWYGPDFHTDNDELFDDLFRQHLRNVYTLCGAVPPPLLDRPVIRARAGQRRYDEPTDFVSPKIDGRIGSFYEWAGAGAYEAGSEQGAMYRAERFLESISFGFDSDNLYLRLDPVKWGDFTLEVVFAVPSGIRARVGPVAPDGPLPYEFEKNGTRALRDGLFAAKEVVEWALPVGDLGAMPGDPVAFQVRVLVDGIEREIYPESGPIQVTVPDAAFAAKTWIV